MKSEKYLRDLLKKSINETLETKADKLMGKIKEIEVEEGFDSPEIKRERGGRDYDKYEFSGKLKSRDFMKDIEMDSTTEDEFDYLHNTKDIDLDDELYDDDDDLDPYIKGDDDYDPIIGEEEKCEVCGSELEEGQCGECGSRKMYEGIYDVEDLSGEFDYTEEEEDEDTQDIIERYCNKSSSWYNKERCDYNSSIVGESVKNKPYKKKEVSEKKKKFPDLSGDGKLTKKDILMGRGVKLGKKETSKNNHEVEEGNEFSGELAKARKDGKKTFQVDGKTYTVKESIEYHIRDNEGDIIKLNENEMVDLIEIIVNEEQKKMKSMGKPEGLATYEKAHKESGKENKAYMKSLEKKMNDYMKDGSKEKYSMEPSHFPKGNGELAKMSKKAYVPSNAVQDYIDNFTAASLENLDYDGISPNEEWVSDLVKGSSRTGNNPKWANAVETGVNDNRDKIRKNNLLGKLKKKAYNKSPQPIVSDKTGEDEGDKIMRRLESIDDKSKKQINEEFDRMKELLGYNRKTQ
jgi:hypothetical protein